MDENRKEYLEKTIQEYQETIVGGELYNIKNSVESSIYYLAAAFAVSHASNYYGFQKFGIYALSLFFASLGISKVEEMMYIISNNVHLKYLVDDLEEELENIDIQRKLTK